MRIVSLLRRRRLVTGMLLLLLLVLVLVLRKLVIRLRLLVRVGLLVLVLGLGIWHVHTLLLSLVALGDRTLRKASLDFVVLLDESTAETPVTDTAVVHAATLDAESLTDLSTLHHGVTRNNVLVDDSKTLV